MLAALELAHQWQQQQVTEERRRDGRGPRSASSLASAIAEMRRVEL